MAVDRLMKSEMDYYRSEQKPHPLAVANSLDLVPFAHPDIDRWRNNRSGLKATYNGIQIWGALDEVWANDAGRLFVVDHKATAKAEPVTALTTEAHHLVYRRQMEFYQFLLHLNGFDVDPTGYFLYSTGDNCRDSFNDALHFSTALIPYQGNFDWIGPKLDAMIECLASDQIPPAAVHCKHCQYFKEVMEATGIVLLSDTEEETDLIIE